MAEALAYLYPKSVKKMAFHYVHAITNYSGVEFNLRNYQKYIIGIGSYSSTLLLVKSSSLINSFLRGCSLWLCL